MVQVFRRGTEEVVDQSIIIVIRMSSPCRGTIMRKEKGEGMRRAKSQFDSINLAVGAKTAQRYLTNPCLHTGAAKYWKDSKSIPLPLGSSA